MPLVAIDCTDDQPDLTRAKREELRSALAQTPKGTPVTILIHGYQFSPFTPDRSPHHHILSLDPEPAPRVVSWPRKLGFSGRRDDEGLCIAFGWPANGSIWAAYDNAKAAGRGLARLCMELADIATGRPINLFGHSLGARVGLSALPYLDMGIVRLAIFMAPAEINAEAEAALDCEAAHLVDLLSVTSGENRIFDFLLERLITPLSLSHKSAGRSPPDHPTWVNLHIDNKDTLAALQQIGFRVAPPYKRICHWSPYLRPGMFPFYRAILDGRLSMARVRSVLPNGHCLWPHDFGKLSPIPLFQDEKRTS